MRAIPQRELRNDVARVLREVDAGETIQVTVRGQVVAELGPPKHRELTPAATAIALLSGPADSSWLQELLDDREAAADEERDVWA